jgi:hypothetical protein
MYKRLHYTALECIIGPGCAGGEGGDTFDDGVFGDAAGQGFVVAALAQHVEFEAEVLGSLGGCRAGQFLDVADALLVLYMWASSILPTARTMTMPLTCADASLTCSRRLTFSFICNGLRGV